MLYSHIPHLPEPGVIIIVNLFWSFLSSLGLVEHKSDLSFRRTEAIFHAILILK